MARQRKAKLRAQRIERDYYLRRHWFRSLRVWLTLGALAAAVLWLTPLLGWRPHRGSPGRVAKAHAMYEQDCAACHLKASDVALTGTADHAQPPVFRAANDAGCRTCHKIPDHHPNQTSTPTCASCHVEHRALPTLSAVATASCSDCHVNLLAHTHGEPTLVRNRGLTIDRFTGDEGEAGMPPEFAVWTGNPDSPRQRLDTPSRPVDVAHLRLNHAEHLKPNLLGPDRKLRVQMVCGDCHWGTLAAPAPRFGTPGPGWAPAVSSDLAPAETTPYMAPVRYAQHCAACHPNSFADVRVPGVLVPDGRAVVVHDFLRGLSTEYLARHPEELKGTPRERPVAGGATATSELTPDGWIRRRVEDAEKVLYRTYDPDTGKPKYCIQCHEMTTAPGASLPTEIPTRVPIRWLPQSRFDHGVHRQLKCFACHPRAETSTETSDILLPDREDCARCHHPGGAGTACSECHTYPAAIRPDAMNGHLDIDGLIRGN